MGHKCQMGYKSQMGHKSQIWSIALIIYFEFENY